MTSSGMTFVLNSCKGFKRRILCVSFCTCDSASRFLLDLRFSQRWQRRLYYGMCGALQVQRRFGEMYSLRLQESEEQAEISFGTRERFYVLSCCLLLIGCFYFSSTLKIVIVRSFKTSVRLYRITWFHIPLDIFLFLGKQRKRFRLNYKVYPSVSLVSWKGKRDCSNYSCLRSVIYALCISVDCNINLPCFGVARIVMNRVCSLEIIFRGAPRPSIYIRGVLKATFSKYTNNTTADRNECYRNDSVAWHLLQLKIRRQMKVITVKHFTV
jgi:hypothetical protein